MIMMNIFGSLRIQPNKVFCMDFVVGGIYLLLKARRQTTPKEESAPKIYPSEEKIIASLFFRTRKDFWL